MCNPRTRSVRLANAVLPIAMIRVAVVRVAMVWIAVAWTATAWAASSLYLVFPYDFLAEPEAERRAYVVGVIDTRLSIMTRAGEPRTEALVECVVRVGIDAIWEVVEETVIPTPGWGVVPMPVLIERGMDIACAR